MNPVAAFGILALIALGLPLLFWYVYVRVKLANNPQLIKAGVGSVKVGLFLRLQRRYREHGEAGGKDVGLLAAAIVNELFGETPKDERVAAFLEGHREDVRSGLRSLAEEDDPLRRLITAALRFQAKLPPPADAAAGPAGLAHAAQDAQELGITVSGRQRLVLWRFAREGVAFLRSEHKLAGRPAPAP